MWPTVEFGVISCGSISEPKRWDVLDRLRGESDRQCTDDGGEVVGRARVNWRRGQNCV